VSRFWDWVALTLFGLMAYVCLALLVITRNKTIKEAKRLWLS
jgi:hypothetical protein